MGECRRISSVCASTARTPRRSGGSAPGHDLGGILDGIEDRRVLGQGGRIGTAAQAVDEVIGRHRIAVAPAPLALQSEGVDEAIVTDRPALGSAGNQRAVGRFGHQAFKEIAQHIGSGDAFRAMRIQGFGLGAVAPAQDLYGGEFLAAGAADRRVCTGSCSFLATTAGHRQQAGDGQRSRQQAPLHARDRRFLRCTSSSETATGVTPEMREAWPTVAGRWRASFWRISCDRP